MKKIFLMLSVLLLVFSFDSVKAYEGFKLTDEIVVVEEGTPYQIEYTGDMEDLEFAISSTYGAPIDEVVATVSKTGLVTVLEDGIVTVEVRCTEEADDDCAGYINSKIKNSLTVLAKKTSKYETLFTEILEEFDERKITLEEEMDKLDTSSPSVNFIRELMTLTFDTTNEKGSIITGKFRNYGEQFLQVMDTWPNYNAMVSDVSLQFNYVGETVEITGIGNDFMVTFEGGDALIEGPSSNKRVVNITFAAGNAVDKKAVMDFAKKIPVVNKSYINVSVSEKFSIESLSERQFANSQAASLIKSNKIDSFVDFRYGDSSPMSAFVGGQIVLGKNGVYYTAQEFKIWSTLKLPRNKKLSLEDNIKDYFESNITGNIEIRVEEDEAEPGVFRVYMKEKDSITLFDKVMNFFAPRVHAEKTEDVITFVVEEVDDINNPQTSVPSLLIYISLASISAIGLVITLKKKKINN